MKRIPISAAKSIAKQYEYSQVVIVARAVGERGGEHVTTYGIDKANCDVAARVGRFFKYKLMGWPDTEPLTDPEPKTRCAECDNSVNETWKFCPYCGAGGEA